MVPVRMEFDTAFGGVTGYLAELHGRGVDSASCVNEVPATAADFSTAARIGDRIEGFNLKSQSFLSPYHRTNVAACDLVGSTALSTRHDPEDLRELIGAYHRAVTETVGRFEARPHVVCEFRRSRLGDPR